MHTLMHACMCPLSYIHMCANMYMMHTDMHICAYVSAMHLTSGPLYRKLTPRSWKRSWRIGRHWSPGLPLTSRIRRFGSASKMPVYM